LRNIESNSLVFECVADNGVDEPLKKKVIISVSGKRSLHSLISFLENLRQYQIEMQANYVILK
jgi:hypothetical protein